jgi:hypothetical protein
MTVTGVYFERKEQVKSNLNINKEYYTFDCGILNEKLPNGIEHTMETVTTIILREGKGVQLSVTNSHRFIRFSRLSVF